MSDGSFYSIRLINNMNWNKITAQLDSDKTHKMQQIVESIRTNEHVGRKDTGQAGST